jgi:xanthine dehydrogenase accessory factor
MREILDRVEEWRARGERVAVATVLTTAGSTPRPAGGKMAVTARGSMAGSISGGCVDTDVIEHAMEVLRTGQPQVVEYGYSPDMTWEIGLMCGGSIQVFIEPLERNMVGPVDDSWMTELVRQAGDPACKV